MKKKKKKISINNKLRKKLKIIKIALLRINII